MRRASLRFFSTVSCKYVHFDFTFLPLRSTHPSWRSLSYPHDLTLPSLVHHSPTSYTSLPLPQDLTPTQVYLSLASAFVPIIMSAAAIQTRAQRDYAVLVSRSIPQAFGIWRYCAWNKKQILYCIRALGGNDLTNDSKRLPLSTTSKSPTGLIESVSPGARSAARCPATRRIQLSGKRTGRFEPDSMKPSAGEEGRGK